MTLIVALAPPLITPVIEMILKQQQWHHALDPRLPAMLSEQEIASSLEKQMGSGLVALCDEEEVCGYGHPGLWQIPAGSLLSAFLQESTGIANHLTLHPERDIQESASALLFALSQMWNFQSREADQICWPSCDSRLERVLLSQRFQVDRIGVFAAKGSLFSPQHFCPPSLHIRPIQRPDVEAVLDLYGEEREYLGMHSPFVRPDEGALVALAEQLEHLFSFSSGQREEGVLCVLVAEKRGQLVGMICFHVWNNTASMHLEYLPPGRYGSLDLISVSAESRELDMRRHLVQAAISHLEPLSLDGLLHCHHVPDPFVSSFWKRQGFVPLWKSYGRAAHL